MKEKFKEKANLTDEEAERAIDIILEFFRSERERQARSHSVDRPVQ